MQLVKIRALVNGRNFPLLRKPVTVDLYTSLKTVVQILSTGLWREEALSDQKIPFTASLIHILPRNELSLDEETMQEAEFFVADKSICQSVAMRYLVDLLSHAGSQVPHVRCQTVIQLGDFDRLACIFFKE